MRLVEDWKQAYSWYSMHAAAVLLVLSALQQLLPSMQMLIPPTVFPWVSAGLAGAIIIGRLIGQGQQ